jgi:PAS domain S-box-containing protein
MSTPIRVLILEDRAADAELMLHELRKADFDPDWQRVEAEPEYLAALERNPGLILADWSLPQFSGQRALQLMNERGLDIPFIIISGSIGEEAAIEAMRQGAADYLLKDRPARLGQAVRLALNDKQLRDERKRAEEMLRIAEERFRTVSMNLTDVIYEWDLKEKIDWFGDIDGIMGYPAGEFPRSLDGWAALIHPEDKERVLKAIEGQLKGLTPYSVEYRLRKKNGKSPWWSARGTVLRDKKGEPYKWIGSITDITERKQAEQALRNSEKRYRELTEFLPISIFEIDTAGHLVSFNQTALQVFGYDEKEYREEMNTLQFFLPEERQRVVENLGKVIQGISPPGQEYIMLRKDGSTFTGLVYASSIIHENITIGIRGAIIDITGRKQAEDALRQSENIVRAWLNAIQESAFLMDREGIILAANATVAQRLRRSVEELVGARIYDFIPPQTAHARRLHMAQVIESGHQVRFEDKRFGRVIDNLIYPVFDQSGQVKYMAILGTDITERKQAEEELIKSEGKFRTIFDNASTGMFIVDLQAQKFFMCNNTCVKMLGYTKEEFLNLDIADIHPREDMSFINEQIGKFSRGEEGIRSDIRFKRKNGSIFASDLNPALLIIADKEYLLISFMDITERKQKDEEIRSRTDELSALYLLSHLLADASNLENVIELVNRHAVESVHTTFACIALMEDGDLVMRAFYPVRVLDHEFSIGKRQPLTALPVCQRVLDKNDPVILQAGSPEVGILESLTLQLDFARSVCLVPLQAGDPSQDINQALGLLILGEAREEKRDAFTPEKIRLAHGIGDQAAAAIRRMLLREQAGRRLQQLASLGEIDRTIASSFDLHVSLQMILQHIIGQLKVDAADILVLNKHLQTLETAAGSGFHSPASENKRLRLGEGQAGLAALERHIIQIPDVATSGAAFAQPKMMKAENITAYFAMPLITKGQVMGVLEIYQRTPLNPNEEWLDFLRTLAGQAAIAIDNVQMFDNLQRSTDELELAYDATIEGWSHALDLRDKETEGHALRVTQMTVNLARTFGLGENELVQVRWGGLLHDIGKMGVPDGILLKPGPLTDEEWVAMKKHPTFAYEMLSPIHYLRLALDIPYCHHEKWDGTGYPRGLKGEQIPLSARIFTVVDVWDALTSDRPYRKAWTREKSKEYIQEQAGKQFDPTVVETFMKEVLQS